MSVVTEDYKYIYWYYGDQSMKPTEELYHLRHDKFEMSNQADNPEFKSALEKMRRLYGNYLGQWKDNCVRRDDYQRYITLLDRNIPVSKKTFKTAPARNKKKRPKPQKNLKK